MEEDIAFVDVAVNCYLCGAECLESPTGLLICSGCETVQEDE